MLLEVVTRLVETDNKTQTQIHTHTNHSEIKENDLQMGVTNVVDYFSLSRRVKLIRAFVR